MPELVEIANDAARVVVAPEIGAAIIRYDLLTGDEPLALLRPPAAKLSADPFASACNLLLPWSNRISGGGFSFGGEFHALEPNVAGEPYPIHGNGFQEQWSVAAHGRDRINLTLSSAGPGPFRYDATVTYALTDGALTMTLDVTNRAGRPLPYGFGFHPWFPRTAQTTLMAPAASVWLEDDRHLPTEVVAVGDRLDWDFATAAPLPGGWINNAFTGWAGTARLAWPEHGVALTLTAADNLPVYIVYSPAPDAGFFCFEPVSHTVDAHNLGADPATVGLLPLADGEAAATWCTLTPAAA